MWHAQGKTRISDEDFIDALATLCNYSTSKARCNGNDMNHVFQHGDCTIPGFQREFDDMDAAWLVLTVPGCPHMMWVTSLKFFWNHF